MEQRFACKLTLKGAEKSGKKAGWVNMLAAKPEDRSCIPGSHMVGENRLLHVDVLARISLHCTHTWASSQDRKPRDDEKTKQF